MSVYTREKIKLSMLFVALIVTILVTFDIILSSINKASGQISSIDKSLKNISVSQDKIIGIMQNFNKSSAALNN